MSCAATGLAEASCRLCGYMSLDCTEGTQADTFKLSFEEQSDTRVRDMTRK